MGVMGLFDQYVIFTLEDQQYTLPLPNVERIVPAAYVTPLPKAPDIVLGIINIQGQVVPVINLRRRFQLPERPLDPADQFIIANTLRRTVVLIVDTVIGVIEIPKQATVHRADLLPSMEHVAGAVIQKDGIILIHDLEACLSIDEERALATALQAA
jgi:purine-binding chemotaxis protein CheW